MKSLGSFLLILFTMCNSNHLPAQTFSGSFKGEQNGITSNAVFAVENQQLTGTIIINGKSGRVSGVVADSLISGSIHDLETAQQYTYTGKMTSGLLHLTIVFPELNNQAVELIMEREAATATSHKAEVTATKPKISKAAQENTRNKNPALVGLWRNTEVISSGSGNNYASFSTDYFLEFKADGSFLSWTGSSAGSGYEGKSAGKAAADKGNWYTEDKTLYLLDPARNEKTALLFYADAEKMMLHNGGERKKIYQRVE